MTDFSKLIANVKKDLRATEGARLSDEDIREAINDAILEYEAERFHFNEGTRELDTVPGQQSYDLPAGVLEIDEIQYDHASRRYRLVQVHYREWTKLSYSATSVVGPAYRYAQFGEKLHLYPIPNQVDTLIISGVMRLDPSPLDDPNQTNGWTNEARRLVRARAAWDLSLSRLHNGDMAALYEAATVSALANLRHRTNQLVSTGQSYVEEWDHY